MKVSINWLRRYVDVPGDLDHLTDRLTQTGFNLEGIERVGDDVVLDLEVTSNRPDCLSHVGIAREISVAFDLQFKPPQVELKESDAPVDQYCSVRIDSPDLCPRYTARIIDGVKVGSSPAWMIELLEAVGLRPVNNVVDVTNFVLMELGQPLHAFDYHKLAGRKILVRRAVNGELITAIDQSRHELTDERLVIADASRPVAVAGVMGGLETEVGEQTTCVLLESAQFSPVSVRRTARELNLHSESSYRFERGVDPVGVELASRRAAALIQELAGGRIAAGVVDVWPGRTEPVTVTLKRDQIKRVLGIELDWQKAWRVLEKLGFELLDKSDGQVTVRAPSWRADVSRPVDLIEELARLEGFDKVPTRETIQVVAHPASALETVSQLVGDCLNACGFYETITPTFQDDRQAAVLTDTPSERMLRVADHVSRQWSVLRCSLLPSLLQVRRRNQDAGVQVSDLYELARVFPPGRSGPLPNERRNLALLSCRDLRVIRGALEQIADAMKLDVVLDFKPVRLPWYQSDAAAEVLLGDMVIGHAGVISREVQEMFDLRHPVSAAEVSFDVLLAQPVQPARYHPLPRFPAIDRDLSLILDEQVRWQQIREAIAAVGLEEMEEVNFTDLFRGKQVPKGKKSITISLRFRRADGSLTHEQADQFQARVLGALQEKLGAVLRAQ